MINHGIWGAYLMFSNMYMYIDNVYIYIEIYPFISYTYHIIYIYT